MCKERAIEALQEMTGNACSDTLCMIAFDAASESVCNWCGIDEVPEGAFLTVLRMAAELLRMHGMGRADAGTDAVRRIQEGDTTVETADGAALLEKSDALLRSYKKSLTRYRRVTFR